MKTNKLVAVISAFVTSLTALFIFGAPHAFAAAKTWTGAGTATVDSTAKTISFTLSSGTNWSGGTAPVTGDSLIFPANLAVVDPGNTLTDDSVWSYVVNNDLAANTSIAGIQFTGVPGADCATVYNDRYQIIGNSISVSGDIRNLYDLTGCNSVYSTNSTIALNLTATLPLTIDVNTTGTLNIGSNNVSFCDTADTTRLYKNFSLPVITGSGTLTIACGGMYSGTSTTFTGDIVVYNSSIASFDTSYGQVAGKNLTIKDKANVDIFESIAASDVVFKRNIIIEGAENTSQNCPYSNYATCSNDATKFVTKATSRLTIYNTVYNYQTSVSTNYKTTLSGAITLSSASHIETGTDVTITGAITGNFSLTPTIGSANGKLTISSISNGSATPNGVYTPDLSTYIYDSDLAYDSAISSGTKAIINEGIKAKNLDVLSNAVLNGKGTIGILTIKAGGILAPGMSPGCLSSGNLIFQGGTYQTELGGTTACTEYDQMKVTGTVTLGSAVTTLTASLYNGFKPKANGSFTIIDNDAADAVSGTFTGLAEGATFTVDGYVFKISYVGGDGNDVVLTTVTVPAVANTGFKLLTTSPIAIILATASITAGAYVLSRRYATVKIK